MTDFKTLCELKNSEHILNGLYTRNLEFISNFIINFLCVSLHLLTVLSDFLISKFKIKILYTLGNLLPPQNVQIITLNWPTCYTEKIPVNFISHCFFILYPLSFMVLLVLLIGVSTLRNLTTETVSLAFNFFQLASITTAFHRPLRALYNIYKQELRKSFIKV